MTEHVVAQCCINSSTSFLWGFGPFGRVCVVKFTSPANNVIFCFSQCSRKRVKQLKNLPKFMFFGF